MTEHELVVDVVDFPSALLNVNAQRGQSRFTGRKAAPWRALGRDLAATHWSGLRLGCAVVWVEVRFPTNHRRDTANLYPTAKALLDGIVDAGVLIDDCDGIVEGPFLRRVYPNGPVRLRIILDAIPSGTFLGRPRTGGGAS